MHKYCRIKYSSEVRARHGVEIEMKIIRPVYVVTAGVPLIKIDATQIYHPKQGGQILYHRKVNYVSRRVADRADLDPLRSWMRRPFHKEELTCRAVRITFHYHGSV